MPALFSRNEGLDAGCQECAKNQVFAHFDQFVSGVDKQASPGFGMLVQFAFTSGGILFGKLL